MKLSKLLTLALVISSLSTVFLTSNVDACTYGWTPGYWKNTRMHPWPIGYNPSDDFETMFGLSDPDFDAVTLMQALQFGGGPEVLGAKMILARAAVASLLSQAALLQKGYLPNYVGAVKWIVQHNWFADRQTIINVAAQLDAYNKLGPPAGWSWP